MSFFESIKALLPFGKAFSFDKDTDSYRFFKGLAALPDDVRRETDKVFFDLFPETTEAIEEWENQFSVKFAAEQYGDSRRGILEALWKSNAGGQSAQYLQECLQKVCPEIKVVENVPIKNPRDANSALVALVGQKQMLCGRKTALCGFRQGDKDFTPTVIRNDNEVLYDIPVDPRYWENYFYVCRNVMRNSRKEIIYCQKLELDLKWKPYVEYLILKLKPAQSGALVFIEWVENLDEDRAKGRRR
ncbi:MAG: hypothetical protein KBT02_00130 [Treponema sp.]|nr:hypothetical protein [Candidatus Treponema caballi]